MDLFYKIPNVSNLKTASSVWENTKKVQNGETKRIHASSTFVSMDMSSRKQKLATPKFAVLPKEWSLWKFLSQASAVQNTSASATGLLAQKNQHALMMSISLLFRE